jgi:hypothetical protein
LRFYAIPNRNTDLVHPMQKNGQRNRATFLQCVPLLHGAETPIFNFPSDSSAPGLTPVKLLISKDWRMGVALVHRRGMDGAMGESQAETTGTMILFTLPRQQCDTLKVYTCQTKVEMATATSQDHSRNLLWLVHAIPCNECTTTCYVAPDCIRNYASIPGYLIFIDEGDGYRLTWCTTEIFLSDMTCRVNVATNESPLKNSLSTSVPILTRQQSWEGSLCDSATGKTIPLSNMKLICGLIFFSPRYCPGGRDSPTLVQSFSLH